MWDTISQFAIMILGPLSLFMVGRKNRWGFVVGLASQPFWFITTHLHQQWGVMGITVLYCFIWLDAIRTWFMKSKKKIYPPVESYPVEDRQIVDMLAKELIDKQLAVIVLTGKFSADIVCDLLLALDGFSRALTKKELRFEFTSAGLIAKPLNESQ